MLRLATCKDLVGLRGRHRHWDDALRLSTRQRIKMLHMKRGDADEPMSHDFVWGLKQMGALFCADKIQTLSARCILEAGAGLDLFFDAHFGAGREYWMIDQSGFYDAVPFGESMRARKHTTYVDGWLGQYSDRLPSGFFDLIFSISVLEHVAFDQLHHIFKDIFRLLKPGGVSIHTLDVNPHSPAAKSKVLIQMIKDAGLEFEACPSELDWNIGRLHDPVLLEPLHIVYEYYYKKSVDSQTDPPYLSCYHFGSILLSLRKPERIHCRPWDHASSVHALPNAGGTSAETIANIGSRLDALKTRSVIPANHRIERPATQSPDVGSGREAPYLHFQEIKSLLKQKPSLFFRDEKLRNYLYQTFPTNPMIPKQIDGIECHTLQPMPAVLSDKFLGDIATSGFPIRLSEFRPDLRAYRTFLEQNAASYEGRFGSNPVHGKGYFFQKTLEHFISYYLIDSGGARDIIDIGSAGHQYAGLLKRAWPQKNVYVQDICFAEGVRALGDRLYQIGGSAAALPLDDNSVDFATLHCALEHFEMDADVRCLLEIERILRPGGKAIIIPLHTHDTYTLMINPISGPFLNENFISEVILPDLHRHPQAKICYTNGMISRFARLHCGKSIIERLFSRLTKCCLELSIIVIQGEFMMEEIISKKYFNGAYSRFIPHPSRCFLQLVKR